MQILRVSLGQLCVCLGETVGVLLADGLVRCGAGKARSKSGPSSTHMCALSVPGALRRATDGDPGPACQGLRSRRSQETGNRAPLDGASSNLSAVHPEGRGVWLTSSHYCECPLPDPTVSIPPDLWMDPSPSRHGGVPPLWEGE